MNQLIHPVSFWLKQGLVETARVLGLCARGPLGLACLPGSHARTPSVPRDST